MSNTETVTKPSPTGDVRDSVAGRTAEGLPPARRTPAVASLRRLLPFAKPALPSLGASALAAIAATVCGLAFPLVILWIIDGPIARHQLSGLWAPALLLVGLGVAEAVLFMLTRNRNVTIRDLVILPQSLDL